MAQHAVFAGNRVRIFSLEMSEEEVRARFHVFMAKTMGVRGIDLNGLRDRTTDRRLYKEFIGDLEKRMDASGGALTIVTPADGPVSPGAVATGAEEYHLNIIDYVGLMRADGGGAAVDDWRLAAKISNSLKEIALSSGTAILGAAQINREGETGFSPPKVKNLAGTDALGQDGDVVVTMRSKEYDVATAFSLENGHGPSGIPFYTVFLTPTGATSRRSPPTP